MLIVEDPKILTASFINFLLLTPPVLISISAPFVKAFAMSLIDLMPPPTT